jgi:hypothetical protein
MGKRSRLKRGRTPAPLGRFSLKEYWLDRSTLLFIAGVLLFAYGSSAMQYSRWDHVYNATVHPVFHPWAAVVGVIAVVIAVRNTR